MSPRNLVISIKVSGSELSALTRLAALLGTSRSQLIRDGIAPYAVQLAALERAGVPRSVAMKLTGHKTESVYNRYAIADAAALAEGVQKLARLHGGGAAPERKVVPIKEATGG